VNNFEKKLQAIRLNAARHCPKLVADALGLLGHDQYASQVLKASHPVWKNILNIMEPLRSLAQDTEASAEYLRKLILLADEKYRNEQHIASMAPINQRKKAALFSNYTEERFKGLLCKFIRHARVSDAEKYILEKRLSSSGPFATLKDLHLRDESAYEQDGKKTHLKRMELWNAVYNAMSQNLSESSPEPLFCGFRHCDLCPRLVRPPKYGVCRCEEHDPQGGTSTAYKRALKICRLMTPEHHSSALEYLQNTLWRELRPILPDKYPEGISAESWWGLLEAEPERLAACAPVHYDLVPVWRVLPRTRKQVEDKGGNPLEPASVLAVLNPPEAGDPPIWKERRTLLNTILTHNFAPFRYELLRTEAWLTIHDQLFGDKKHGGARPGSGGARPGAGRPRKHG